MSNLEAIFRKIDGKSCHLEDFTKIDAELEGKLWEIFDKIRVSKI